MTAEGPAGSAGAQRDVPLLLSCPGTRVLLVGTGAHAPGSRLPAVPAAAATVEDLGGCLVERAGLDPANLVTLVDPPDPGRLSEVMFRTAQEAASVLVLCYVGHGVVGSNGELHLATRATVDLTRGVAAYQALPYSVVREVLSACRAEDVVIVLDCCFAGRAGGVPRTAVDCAFDAAWSGAYLLASSGRDAASWAPPDRRHTAFTGELIRLLREGDPTAPRVLTLDHVYRCLARTLPEKGFPRPRRQATDLGDRRPFAVNPAYRAPGAVPAPPLAESGEESPYRGLAVFRAEDEDVFYGRDRLTRSLVARVRERLRQGGPLLVTGPSGSGKSSVLQAGLIPGVRRAAAGGLSCLVLTPGSDPVGELTRRIAPLTGRDPEDLRACLEAGPDRLGRLLRAAGGPVLVIVDQFEELFTACPDEARRRVFVAALAAACGRGEGGEGPPAAVVLAVRADFFGHCASHPELLEALKHPEIVGPMTAVQLREVIEKPAERAGLALEEGLVNLLLEDLGADGPSGVRPGALPLLSHALLATWQRRTGNVLTLAAYRASGGIARSVALSADATLRRLGPRPRSVARDLLLRLVHLETGTDDTRRRVPLAELFGGQERDEAAVREALGAFVRARLVTVGEDGAEITHEALIRAWPQLREWIDTDRASLLVCRHLTADAETWQRHARDPAYLYSDSRLAAAQAAVRAAGGGPAALEREFLDASARRDRRRRRTATSVIAALAALLLVAVTTGVYARRQGQEALDQRNRATARQLVGTALKVPDAALAAQLRLAAYRLAAIPETRGAVLAARTRPLGARVLGHTGYVYDVAVSPDGRTFASASADRTARLWDVRDPDRPRQTAVLGGHADEVNTVAFRPDGGLLATASRDGAVVLWDPAGPRPPRRITGFRATGQSVNTAAFSPDGALLALSSADRTARLWDVRDPARPRQAAVLNGHTEEVRTLAFSPDGRTLATSAMDRTARLWDVTDPGRTRTLSVLRGHTRPLQSVAFAPGGATLVTGAQDATVRVWDVRDPARPRLTARLTDATDSVYDLAFTRDGRLAGTSNDNGVYLWEPGGGGVPVLSQVLEGHADTVFALAVHPGSGDLVTASGDRTLRTWRVGGAAGVSGMPGLAGHRGRPWNMAVSRDGGTVAGVFEDGTGRLWDVRDLRRPRALGVLEGHRNGIRQAAFSPDGGLLATASWDGTVRVWDVRDPARPRARAAVRPGKDLALAVRFSRDGRALVASSQDRTVGLWDVTDPARPERVAALSGLREKVPQMEPSPDGRILAVAPTSGSAHLYDVRDVRRPVRLGTLTIPVGALTAVAFAPGGRVLATMSTEGAVALWDVSVPSRPAASAVFTAHPVPGLGAAFSPDGRTLATTGQDATLRLWDVADPARPRLRAILQRDDHWMHDVRFLGGRDALVTFSDEGIRLWSADLAGSVRYVCEHSGSPITRHEWRQHVPDLPYDPPCR
ncbi:caspase, EACC1-associated type [Planomonospora alba]|uniref:caspase, EACC1-associated type n=1 Tax=Planomonospora alba TaxID=161354 RepID=UPI0031F0DD34